ncbi:hypothetical protein ACQX4O_10235, partial [Corynebacterium diphtheriae]
SCAILAILGVFHASKRVDQRAHGFVGCLHVGHSLMGSASMTVTSPCSAVRQMVSTMIFPLGCTVGPWLWVDGLDTLFPTKLRALVSCATPEPSAS